MKSSVRKNKNLVDNDYQNDGKLNTYSRRESHYGLAFDYYSHFTPNLSPSDGGTPFATYYLDGGKSADEEIYEAQMFTFFYNSDAGPATSAERDHHWLKKYMQDHAKIQEF
jgi:ribonuclease R